MIRGSELRPGDFVRVRSKEDILATLDERGQLEGLPFMPEMLAFCGQRLRVAKRAHKTCDPPSGLEGRRMRKAVHLENIRCDGAAHGGCQARCLMFWKEAWLEKIGEHETHSPLISIQSVSRRCNEQDVWAGARDAAREGVSPEPLYVCQSTQIPFATERLAPWDFSQYIEDYTSGNVRLSEITGAFIAFVCQQLINAGLGLGTPLRLAYNGVQKLRRGVPYPWRRGAVAAGEKTPSAKLDLQPGELVKVKPYDEILKTINQEGNNRGMSFDAEMVPYCGGTYRVLDRVNRIINEKSGAMQTLKNDCIILDEVVCLACYSEKRRFCPRAIYPYWREIWLERVPREGGPAL